MKRSRFDAFLESIKKKKKLAQLTAISDARVPEIEKNRLKPDKFCFTVNRIMKNIEN